MLHASEAEFLSGVRMSEYEKLRETTLEALERAHTHLRAAELMLTTAKDRVKALEDLLGTLEKARAALSPDVLNSVIVDGKAIETISKAFINPVKPRGELPPSHIAMLAKDALLENKAPMKRGRLAKLLVSRGVPLAGKDKSKNLGTIMWRHPEQFVSIPSLGYWVKGIPLEGVYDPATDGDGSMADNE